MIPRSTKIAGQRHTLAYINPFEVDLLKSYGGTGVPGPGGIPSFPPESVMERDYAEMRGVEPRGEKDKRVAGLRSDRNYGKGSYAANRDLSDPNRAFSPGSSSFFELTGMADPEPVYATRAYTAPAGEKPSDVVKRELGDFLGYKGKLNPEVISNFQDIEGAIRAPYVRGEREFRIRGLPAFEQDAGILGAITNFRNNAGRAISTDLSLGLGRLTGALGGLGKDRTPYKDGTNYYKDELEGFTKAMKDKLGYDLTDDQYRRAYENFVDTSNRTQARQDALAAKDEDYDSSVDPLVPDDPCPTGFKMDPVTNMCVPDDDPFLAPFPTLPGAGASPMPPATGVVPGTVVPASNYTQAMPFTAPRITPPDPRMMGIAGIPMAPIG